MGKRVQSIFGLVWVATLIAACSAFGQSTSPTTQPQASKAAVVVLQGAIDDYSRDAFFRRFSDARRVGADVVIIQLDTPGGSIGASLDISRFIKQQTDVHTIAFIHNEAYSGGTMVALACDEIVMEPNSAIGDCAPILLRYNRSLEPLPETERAKIEGPVLADFRDSAERNGYSPLLVESMVSLKRIVHYVESPDGVKRFVNAADYDKLTKDGWKPVEGVRDPVVDVSDLLTVHTDQAKRLGLCKEVATSPGSLASSRNYQIVDTFAPSAGEAMIEILNSSAARIALIVMFIISLKIAFSVPGHGAPEAVALVSLGLIVGVPLLTGYAQWWEIAIIFVGLALLAFEIFVFPGHFVSAILGLLMVIGGLVMTFVPKEPGGLPGFLPSMNGTYTALQHGLLVVVSGLVCSLLLWFWLQRYLPKLPYFRHLVLTTTVGSTDSPDSPIESAAWPLVGATGRAITDLRPSGKAAFVDDALGDERITQVVSDGGFVVAGTRLVVREVAGNRVVVRTV